MRDQCQLCGYVATSFDKPVISSGGPFLTEEEREIETLLGSGLIDEQSHVRALLVNLVTVRAENANLRKALADAAKEINVAGPVSHRIRMLRGLYEDTLRVVRKRIRKLEDRMRLLQTNTTLNEHQAEIVKEALEE